MASSRSPPASYCGTSHDRSMDTMASGTAMYRHVAHCIGPGQMPLSVGAFGIEVVRLLERAEASLEQHGKELKIS